MDQEGTIRQMLGSSRNMQSKLLTYCRLERMGPWIAVYFATFVYDRSLCIRIPHMHSFLFVCVIVACCIVDK